MSSATLSRRCPNAPRRNSSFAILKHPLTRYKRALKTRSKGPTEALLNCKFTLQVMTTKTSPQRDFRLEESDSEITSLHAGVLLRYNRFFNDNFELTDEEKRLAKLHVEGGQ